MKALKRLNAHLFRYRKLLLLGILFVSLSNILKVYNPVLVQETIDYIVDFGKEKTINGKMSLNEADREIFYHQIFVLSMKILALALSSGFFLYLTRQTIIVMSRFIEYDMKNEIYKHYQTLPLSFYRSNNTGDLMNRISDDVSKVRMYIGPAIMYGLNLIVIFILVIPIMISVNPILTLWCLIPLPFLSLGIYFISEKINKQSDRIQANLSELSTFVQEAFSGIRVLKSFVKENESTANFAAKSEEYKQKSLELTVTNSFFHPIIFGLIGLSTISTIYFGGLMVLEQEISYGNIAQFFLYLNMITWPVTSVGWVTSIIQRAAASQDRINEFLDEKSNLKTNPNNEIQFSGNIEFKNVSLTYPDSGIEAIHNLSFKINAGETIAIVGPTGSGKSTIANLICRMYDPTNGTILYDNQTFENVNLFSIRNQTGYVPQDAFLFSDSIRNNIAFADEKVSDEEIFDAAKNAGVYDNIIDFPNGFNTVLGERGVTVSGGQKQRITLARAIIKNPNLLILDDSLSAVDTKTEDFILTNLKSIMKNRTSIIIAHRISSVQLADRIFVIDNGRLVQEGTHHQLITIAGPYKDLYENQLDERE